MNGTVVWYGHTVRNNKYHSERAMNMRLKESCKKEEGDNMNKKALIAVTTPCEKRKRKFIACDLCQSIKQIIICSKTVLATLI